MPERDFDMTSPGAPIETVGNRDLVASDRVEGTTVYDADREKVGHVHNFMVSKRTGQVAHVIVSDAGFLGLGAHRYMAVSWDDLTYSEELGGYLSGISKARMQAEGRESADDAEMQIW